MKKHKVQSIGDILTQFIRGTELEKNLLEKQVIQSWPKVMGSIVANLTSKLEIKNGVLFVHIYSAALRQQLFECRYDVIKKINQEINANFIKDIRFLG
jgi:predicted nucleic acid-binding Zn ribbon protein